MSGKNKNKLAWFEWYFVVFSVEPILPGPLSYCLKNRFQNVFMGTSVQIPVLY